MGTLMMEEPVRVMDPSAVAKEAGLRYVSDSIKGYSRERDGEKYRYFDHYGEVILNDKIIHRINSLVIPHIWQNVWICPFEKGHLQATGIDTKNRKQYRYHKEWERARNINKYGRMLQFGQLLPEIRQKVESDLNQRKLNRLKVLATVVTLLDEKLIRIGNKTYEQKYQTYGLTTLKDQHVKNLGGKLMLEFKGKKSIEKQVIISDKKLANIIRKCKELPGYDLFQYLDDFGNLHSISSEDVNEYLREITGESFTAKDFRTWGGSSIAMRSLLELEPCETEKQLKKNITSVVKEVSTYLGNTPNVCKNYYIHPIIFEKYSNKEIYSIIEETRKKNNIYDVWLTQDEKLFLELLKK